MTLKQQLRALPRPIEFSEDEIAELASVVINQIIDIVGVDVLIVNVPDEWEYSESMGGDNPTKTTFVWWWLWDRLVAQPEANQAEGGDR